MDPIVFQNVTKVYGESVALRDVSFSITQNKTTVVIGPSGSGKSTLVQLINALERPDQGVVRIFGEEIDYSKLPTLRRAIGYAVQGTGLFPHLTVEKNITLLARLQKWSEEKMAERANTLMQLVDLPPSYAQRYPHELSGGEQQRVGLCRAMMLDPKIFLLDEPFGALDPLTRSEVHQEFLKLQRAQARTIVLVTHDLREALKLGNRIMILREGQIEQIGTREQIIEGPATAFVQSFVHTQLEDSVDLPS